MSRRFFIICIVLFVVVVVGITTYTQIRDTSDTSEVSSATTTDELMQGEDTQSVPIDISVQPSVPIY